MGGSERAILVTATAERGVRPVSEPSRQLRPRYGELAPRAADGPIDLCNLVAGSGPIEIEVGFGRGAFLIERARTAALARIIGIEVKAKWACLVAARIDRERLANARVMAGDARDILRRAGPAGSVARVFIHFPDPWWKKRHARRRVLDPRMLDELARLLARGGELFVQTDVEERAAEHLAVIGAHAGFVLPPGGLLQGDHHYGVRSNRERRALADGLPIYRLLARRL